MQVVENIIVSINFDERSKYKVVNQDDTFNVWVSTIINQDVYNTSIVTDLDFVKISDYQYEVTADLTGFHTIHIQVNDKEKLTFSQSNTLLAIVG